MTRECRRQSSRDRTLPRSGGRSDLRHTLTLRPLTKLALPLGLLPLGLLPLSLLPLSLLPLSLLPLSLLPLSLLPLSLLPLGQLTLILLPLRQLTLILLPLRLLPLRQLGGLTSGQLIRGFLLRDTLVVHSGRRELDPLALQSLLPGPLLLGAALSGPLLRRPLAQRPFVHGSTLWRARAHGGLLSRTAIACPRRISLRRPLSVGTALVESGLRRALRLSTRGLCRHRGGTRLR